MFWKKWFSGRNKQAEPAPGSVDLRAVVISDIGMARKNNEDAARFIRPAAMKERMSKGCLAIVADGMGGHAAGEVAAQMAVDLVGKTYFQREELAEESLFFAVSKANRAIWQLAGKNARYKGMGTTCTAMAICDKQLYLAHVGDSRAYLFKKGQLFQLSRDHTYVQSLVDQGVITAEEAEKHPEKNVLTKALGTRPKLEPDIVAVPQKFEPEDRLLLCSDGLYSYLSNEEISQLLLADSLSEAARQLVELAKQRGGHDNITVVLAEHVSEEAFRSIYPTEEIR